MTVQKLREDGLNVKKYDKKNRSYNKIVQKFSDALRRASKVFFRKTRFISVQYFFF